MCISKRQVYQYLFSHFAEALVPKDTSVVDEDIHTAKVVHGRLNDLLALHHGVIVCDRHATFRGKKNIYFV